MATWSSAAGTALAAAAVVVGLTLSGVALADLVTDEVPPSPAPAVPSSNPATGAAEGQTSPPKSGTARLAEAPDSQAMAMAEPVELRVPAFDVVAAVDPLGVDDDSRLEVPDDPDRVGWYRYGSRPGEPGPAVLVGHVDSRDDRGVFYDVARLQPGDDVLVRDAQGQLVRFEIYEIEQVPKDEFPTERVYGDVPAPELRLVTCGGEFDESTGHYADNVVAYATTVG